MGSRVGGLRHGWVRYGAGLHVGKAQMWVGLRREVGSGVGGLRSMWVWIQARHHDCTWAAGFVPLAWEMPSGVSQMVAGSYTMPIKNGRIQLAPFECCSVLAGWAVSQDFMQGAGMGSRSLPDTLWMVAHKALERVRGTPWLNSLSRPLDSPNYTSAKARKLPCLTELKRPISYFSTDFPNLS